MASLPFDDIPANQNGDNRVKPTNQDAKQEMIQLKQPESVSRAVPLGDYQNDHPSPKTVPTQLVGHDQRVNSDPLDSYHRPKFEEVQDHEVVGPTPNTGEKIIEAPTVARPTAKTVAHSILSHNNQHRLDVNRPRKSLSWDLPKDRLHQSGSKFVPTDRLPEIVSQPPSSASDETARDVQDRSFWPDRLQSSPAPMEDSEQSVPPKPQEFPWWQRGPFYNDFTSGRNYSRVGSVASTSHKPSFSSDFIPRAPSISSQYWNDPRGRTSRRGSSIGWRSRCSSYVPDVCHDSHCHFHRYPHSMHYSSPTRHDLSFSCTCHTYYNRRRPFVPSDDFSLYERSATMTTFESSDISTQNPPKTTDGGEGHLDDDSEVQQRRRQMSLMEQDLRDMQDEMFDIQRDVADLERQRLMVENDVDYLLGKRQRLEAQIDQLNVQAKTMEAKTVKTVDLDEVLRKHLDRIEELASGRPAHNSNLPSTESTRPLDLHPKASTLKSNPVAPDFAPSSSASPATAQLLSEDTALSGNVWPSRQARPACVIFTEPFTRGLQFAFPISHCLNYNDMKSMILQSMEELGPTNPQYIKVGKDEFYLKDQNGRVINPSTWQFLVYPDMHVTLVFWPDSQRPSSRSSSPLPNFDGPDNSDDVSRARSDHVSPDAAELQSKPHQELEAPEDTFLTDNSSNPQSPVGTPFEEIAQPDCDA